MAGDLAYVFDLVRLGVSGAFALVGLVFLGGGSIGVLRFPDFYTRLHAANVADAAGGVVLLLALAVGAPDWRVALKLVLIAALLAALAPLLAQLTANAGHAAGLAPLAGPYVAPRPGAAKRAEPSP